MPLPRVIHVEDDEGSRLRFHALLSKCGVAEVVSFKSIEDACASASQKSVDWVDALVLLDMRWKAGSADGITLLRHLKEQGLLNVCTVAVCTSFYEDYEETLREFQTTCIGRKTATNSELLGVLGLALENAGWRGAELAARLNLVGSSVALRHVRKQVFHYAPVDSSVLITGETGTGKENVARAIHNLSPRHDKPFIVLDCGAAQKDLIESELFGHVRGAFTGATHDRVGAFEAADGGTLFLDEIGDLPLSLQPILLRTLEKRETKRLGTNNYESFDVRIIAATNRDLAKDLQMGAFRSDLYYRLSVAVIELPPLRERLEDIDALVPHLLKGMFRAGTNVVNGAMPPAIKMLRGQMWLGNIRELRNILERACLYNGTLSQLGQEAVSLALASDATTSKDATVKSEIKDDEIAHLRNAMAQYEADYIKKAMVKAHGSRTKAAELLGISAKCLHDKLNRYGLRSYVPEPLKGDRR